MDVFQGGTKGFTVVAKNQFGEVVPDTNITATIADTTIATDTVNGDGSNGVVTGVLQGATSMTATDGTLTSPAEPVNVTQDLKPATLTIVPAP